MHMRFLVDEPDHNRRSFPFPSLSSLRKALGLALLVPLIGSACSSGNEAGDFGGELFVESCSLGCNNGNAGDQVFCSIVNTFRNQDIAVTFSEPIQLTSVDSTTFRVVEVQNGTSPTGSYFLDPTNPRRLIFRPSLTFDSFGNPRFGFAASTAYQVTIPGEAQGDNGPFILSTAGRPNQSRLQCTIFTDQGVIDPVPGPPTVSAFILAPGNDCGSPALSEITDDPTDNVDVPSDAGVRMVFNDIMNPASLANNSTGNSPFVELVVDVDGDLATTADRTPVSGRFSVTVDQQLLTTELCFFPDLGFPSGGSVSLPPSRPILIIYRDGAIDLVGNSVTTDDQTFFPQRVDFGELILDTSFDDVIPMDEEFGPDLARSGGTWGAGSLVPGTGGGSGRLGDLIIRNNETVMLDTEGTEFPLPNRPIDLMGNPDMNGMYPGFDGTTFEITDGTFEFATVDIQPGGTLIATGANPLRIFSRGALNIAFSGTLDVSGTSAGAHDSSIALPEMGVRYFRTLADPTVFDMENVAVSRGLGGPAGGNGGFGGDRFNFNGNDILTAFGDAPTGDPESDAIDMGVGVVTDGNGRSGDPVIMVGAPDTSISAGRGGAQNPVAYPVDIMEPEALNYNIVGNQPDLECRTRQIGGVGSGGGYASAGTAGMSISTDPTADDAMGADNNGPATDVGQSLTTGIDIDCSNSNCLRLLRDARGFLRGGAGGGGGGSHAHDARSVGPFPPEPQCSNSFSRFMAWHDHSGAAGGGGGGAVYASSSVAVTVQGIIDASGGAGGRSAKTPEFDPTFGQYAMPGGGGAGGAVRIAAPTVTLGGNPGRIDVSGGPGGTSHTFPATIGGSGGTGLVRIEDSDGTVSRATLAPGIAPLGPNDSEDFLSVGPAGFNPGRQRPDGFNGTVSCWYRPAGSFFSVNFAGDVMGGTPAEMGWNMTVLLAGGGTEDFRGSTAGETPFEEMWGNTLNHGLGNLEGSGVAVRFQGARITQGDGLLCDVTTDGMEPDIVPGSLTPWVQHPEELNAFPIPPNAIRFAVIFDPFGQPLMGTSSLVVGVDNLRITANPQ